jgi:hypothetical protein
MHAALRVKAKTLWLGIRCNARSIKSKGKNSMARNQEECWSSTKKISSSYHRNEILLSPWYS